MQIQVSKQEKNTLNLTLILHEFNEFLVITRFIKIPLIYQLIPLIYNDGIEPHRIAKFQSGDEIIHLLQMFNIHDRYDTDSFDMMRQESGQGRENGTQSCGYDGTKVWLEGYVLGQKLPFPVQRHQQLQTVPRGLSLHPISVQIVD